MRAYFLPLIIALSSAQATPQECLGRLSFNLPKQFQWATSQASVPMASYASFSDRMYLDSDRWDYKQRVSLMVTEPTSDNNAFTSQWKAYMPRTIWLQEQQKKVKAWTGILEDMNTKHKEQQEMKARGESFPEGWTITKEGIARAELNLKVAQDELFEMENRKIPQVPLAIADAYTIDYPDQRAFVRRHQRDYMFYFSTAGKQALGIAKSPVSVAEVNQQLAHFEPRQLGQRPNKTGFCFPYGFIVDDGTKPYEIKNSFRFIDQPNVAYTLYTGDNHFFSKGKVATYGVQTELPRLQDPSKFTLTKVNQTLTFKNGSSLTLSGWNAVENTPADPKQPRHYYWLWGQLTNPRIATSPTDVPATTNSFVVVQIKAFDKDEQDGRPHYAPPLATALKRLEPLLDSVQFF